MFSVSALCLHVTMTHVTRCPQAAASRVQPLSAQDRQPHTVGKAEQNKLEHSILGCVTGHKAHEPPQPQPIVLASTPGGENNHAQTYFRAGEPMATPPCSPWVSLQSARYSLRRNAHRIPFPSPLPASPFPWVGTSHCASGWWHLR